MNSNPARGWVVTFAGTGLNLALGVLYSWSVIGKALTKDWGWSAQEASLPYSVAIGVFAVMMVFAGRAQDRFGPRLVASIGGALTGIGLLVASFASKESAWPMVVGFGLLAGSGFGLGYASSTPPAVKWFPPSKKGLITGLVVSGFGLASVYIAPLTNWLLGQGITRTFVVLGVAFLIVTVTLAQLLQNPPAGYTPAAAPGAPKAAPARADFEWSQMMKTRSFYFLWFMYASASFAGLMIIGHMAKIAGQQLPGVNLGFVLVAVLAIFNATGRVVAGVLSDRIGRVATMRLVFISQAVLMAVFAKLDATGLLLFGAALVGFNYGANLSLFPAATADFFGTRHLGVNYGLVFTAWGVGGVFGGMVAAKIVDQTGSYQVAFYVAGALCILATVLSVFTRAPSDLATTSSAQAAAATAKSPA